MENSTTVIKERTPIRSIGLDEVWARMDELVFVDARSATALSRNPQQIPGAVHISSKELENGTLPLPRKRTIVTYCT